MSNTKVVVVYFSGYGHTRKLAEAVLAGAQGVAGTEASLVEINAAGDVTDEGWDLMNQADAMLLGSPTYMGTVAWQFKKFADASSKMWAASAWKDKLAGGFTNSGSLNGDKHSTIAYLMTFAMQHGMVWVGTGLMPANKKDSTPADINHLGAFSGLMAQSPADASAEEAPRSGDLATAKLYGARLAEAAKRWK
ncbi:MAG TPA: flavodoxin family protein [Limnobacter sp.]|uniref:flavodoxin family protein n=1 Tax=Limnobacter sp. TaxID=2003368 RepID=UPI002E304325|nr:flavodoxin family protein [Limnobacter sp.]HEX5486268.1 flavodoxin family protein [Limnobacter sp.]